MIELMIKRHAQFISVVRAELHFTTSVNAPSVGVSCRRQVLESKAASR